MTPFMPYVYLVIAVGLEVIATSALKASNSFTNLLPTVVMVVGYLVSFYLLSLVMRSIPVGITYALWSGLGIVSICVLSSVLFKEVLDLPAIIGLGFIIAGIVIVQVFSKVSHGG